LHSFVEHIRVVLLSSFFDNTESIINDATSCAFLALEHYAIDKLRNEGSPNFGSGTIGRFSALLFSYQTLNKHIHYYFLPAAARSFCFRSLSTVFRATLLATINTLCIGCTTNNVITNTGQVLYSATANIKRWSVPEVMTFARNISSNSI
jgi:hypothetical protein